MPQSNMSNWLDMLLKWVSGYLVAMVTGILALSLSLAFYFALTGEFARSFGALGALPFGVMAAIPASALLFPAFVLVRTVMLLSSDWTAPQFAAVGFGFSLSVVILIIGLQTGVPGLFHGSLGSHFLILAFGFAGAAGGVSAFYCERYIDNYIRKTPMADRVKRSEEA